MWVSRCLKNRLKRQVLLSVIIGICILIVLVPEASSVTASISAPVSLSPHRDNQALLPMPFKASENLSRTKRYESNSAGKTVSLRDAVAYFWICRLFSLSHYAIFGYLSNFDTTLRGGLQQACQLLDIPPPSDIVSKET